MKNTCNHSKVFVSIILFQTDRLKQQAVKVLDVMKTLVPNITPLIWESSNDKEDTLGKGEIPD